jgi:tetratricopeptide (TPR) repeat protein
MDRGLVSPRPPPPAVLAALGVLALVGLVPAPARAAPPFWVRAAALPDRSTGEGRPPAAEAPARFVELGLDETRRHHYAAAAKAYGAAVAAGGVSASLYTNLAEVLMADGHLAEAEGHYRDAIAVANDAAAGNPRERIQDLALAHYGLAVALDRDGQPIAAREMMGRALALDPTAAVLAVATLGNGDLFFVPDGEVFYYLGLAAAVTGRRADALEAFRQFTTRAPQSRWIPSAQAHLLELSGAGAPLPQARALRGPRVVAIGTVLATGGLPAPLIDAAWRDQAAILDDCLDMAAGLANGGEGLRIALEIEVDGRGGIVDVAAKVPSAQGAALARCLETAVKTRFRLRPPARARPTRARTEIIIGFPSDDGAGYR